MQKLKNILKTFKKRRAIIATIVTILIASLTVTALYITRNNSEIAEKEKKRAESHIGTVIMSEASDLKKQGQAPSSGPLDYQFLTTYQGKNSDTITYVYVTAEYRDDRLIELNNEVIAELRTSGKISDQTKTYVIGYFNNSTVASTYFIKVNDPNTTEKDRLALKDSYVASMTYSRQLGLNFLIKIGTAKVLKNY